MIRDWVLQPGKLRYRCKNCNEIVVGTLETTKPPYKHLGEFAWRCPTQDCPVCGYEFRDAG